MRRPWTAQEIRRLKERYAEHGTDAVEGRTAYAVYEKAKEFGLTTAKRRWTEKEDARVLRGAGTVPGRTNAAVVGRRWRLNRRAGK